MTIAQELVQPPTAAPRVAGFPGPLQVVHYIPAVRLEHGGVVRAILDWCTVFAERGHHVTLITYQGDDVPREWLMHEPGRPLAFVVPAPRFRLKRLGRKAMKISDAIIRQADILHLHGPWFDGNRQLANLARKHHVPYLISAHGMLDDWSMAQRRAKKLLYMRLVGRRMLDGAAAIHCTAEHEKVQACKWYSSPSSILPYLVNMKPFEVLPGPEQGLALVPVNRRNDPKILFLSRLHEKKGVDILIRAAGIMRDKGVEFVMLIAGTGDPLYERLLYGLTDSLNLRDRVFFIGLVTGTQKISLYQAADVFVLPTLQENFGLVLTEAMACGTAVITTQGTDIWSEVQAAGAVIADTTPQSMSDAISALLANPQERAARGARGREWTFETLAIEPLAKRYEELYRSLAKRRR